MTYPNPVPNLFKHARATHWDFEAGNFFVENDAEYGCWDNGDEADGYHFPGQASRIAASFSILLEHFPGQGWCWQVAWQDATGGGSCRNFDSYEEGAEWVQENIWTDDRGRLRIGR